MKTEDGCFLDIGWWKDIQFTKRLCFSSQTCRTEILRNHLPTPGALQSKPLVLAERYMFYQCRQENTENVAAYLAALRKCAEYCNFGDFLQQALRDRFVCGLNSSAIQKRLLAESDLTLKCALEIVQSMEPAARQAEYLNLSKPTASGDQDEVHVMTGGMAQNSGNKPKFIKVNNSFREVHLRKNPPYHVSAAGDRVAIHIHANLRTNLSHLQKQRTRIFFCF